ncbi:PucR family transcriptional regulator [Microbacterium sp. 4R-513]|uniref:PucR family transcriptional regulator n=1 Tax=Microbacterium sp. 4R-513 TaxID=2567934 RepID=UPI0013E1AC1A|nr:PucR family transcriptional regulator [Microbacterium sp. 4R-513]QIG39814.1 PucR family transcriptional regulator [Microbacterium sp. 4R-513]
MDAATEAATLRALLRRHELHLTLQSDESDLAPGALDHAVRWVHSSDLADPTPFLSEGLALLTTGRQFLETGEDPAVFRAYVHRLSARGVVGLGFGTEVVRAGIPPALTDACREEGMPLFEVPYRTPFIAVARANAEAIAAQAYARRSWALAAQRAIALAALRPDGLGATLAELSRQLDMWVGLFDAAGALTREHPIAGLSDGVREGLTAEVGAVLRRGARAGSSLRIGDQAFTMQTLGRGGHLRGVIAIAGAELDQEGRGVVTSVVAMAGLAFEQQQRLTRAHELLRTGLVQSLLAGDPALSRRIARDLWGGFPAPPVLVAVTDPTAARADAVAEWLTLRASESRGAVFHGRAEDHLVVVSHDEHVLAELAERFGARLGVSEPVPWAEFADAHAQAVTALRRGGQQVSRFREIAASGVLSALDSDAARSLAAARLAPLREHDAAQGAALVETLRAWLEQDARIDAAAAALGVHRHTVRARIGLAQRLLGTDLTSFAARADLWAALQVSREV